VSGRIHQYTIAEPPTSFFKTPKGLSSNNAVDGNTAVLLEKAYGLVSCVVKNR
jgi:hypothetical protein